MYEFFCFLQLITCTDSSAIHVQILQSYEYLFFCYLSSSSAIYIKIFTHMCADSSVSFNSYICANSSAIFVQIPMDLLLLYVYTFLRIYVQILRCHAKYVHRFFCLMLFFPVTKVICLSLMGWLWFVGWIKLYYRSLLQNSPVKEMIFCKRDVEFYRSY